MLGIFNDAIMAFNVDGYERAYMLWGKAKSYILIGCFLISILGLFFAIISTIFNCFFRRGNSR